MRAAGHRVIPLPGPCAAIAALSASGLTDPHFLFYGFLPAKSRQREDALREVGGLPYTLVFYEAPHRILDTVASLNTVLGEARTLVIARELTKLFETIHVCRLGDALPWFEADSNRQRGEFVLMISGAPETNDDRESERVLQILLDDGLAVSQAARLAHAITGASKNALYERALSLKKDESA